MTATSNEVTANGIRIHYLRAGPRGGTPLILLHGWPEFSHVWHKVIARLEDRFDLIAPDLRGFGKSEKPDKGPSRDVGADVHAEDVRALMDALDIQKAGVVGHDVGAYVMQSFARAYPERLNGLLFFNCPTPAVGKRWIEPSHLKEIWYQSFHQKDFAAQLVGASRETCRIYFGYFLRHWSKDPATFDAELETWVDNFMQPGNLQGGFNYYLSANAKRLAAMRGEKGPPEKIATRTRVVWGRHDPVLKSEWSDCLSETFSNYTLTFAENSAHFVHYEEPDLAAREIAAFFG